MSIIRIGIIGTGRIANRFVPEAQTVKEIQIASVYNPRMESAAAFAERHRLSEYTDDWEAFCASIDAAYVAAPHDTHYGYVRQLLIRGKHVLCEKPLCFSGEEARELFELANRQKLVLMEAVKTAYCPGFCKLLEVAQSGIIGEIKDVEACFTKLSDPFGRELNSKQYAGSFYELGTYALLPAIKLLGKPAAVQFQCIRCGKQNTDGFTKAYLTYENAFALAKTGLSVKSEGCLIVSGTKGYILAESPWWLTQKFQVRFDDPNQIEEYTATFEGQGLRYELQNFAQKIAGGSVFGGKEYGLKPEESVWMAEIMEAFYRL